MINLTLDALGGSVPRIIVRHILLNVASTFMVIATLELARAEGETALAPKSLP